MDSFEVKRNIESGRGRLEVVNGRYVCYIDRGHTITGMKPVCLVGEIRSEYGGVYEVYAVWNSDSIEKEIKKLHGSAIEFSNLRRGPYRITKGQYGVAFEDRATLHAAYGDGYIDQCDLESRIREEEQRIIREEQINIRHRQFDSLLQQVNMDFEMGYWKQYINKKFRLMREFKDLLIIKEPFGFNYRFGYAYVKIGEPKEALKWYKKAFRIEKRIDLYYTIASLYEELGVNQAIKWYKSLVKVENNPENIRWVLNRVVSLYLREFYLSMTKPRKAVRVFDKLAKWIGIKRLNFSIVELKELLKRKTDDKQRKEVLYSLARDYSKRGNFGEGIKYYQIFIKGLGIKNEE